MYKTCLDIYNNKLFIYQNGPWSFFFISIRVLSQLDKDVDHARPKLRWNVTKGTFTKDDLDNISNVKLSLCIKVCLKCFSQFYNLFLSNYFHLSDIQINEHSQAYQYKDCGTAFDVIVFDRCPAQGYLGLFLVHPTLGFSQPAWVFPSYIIWSAYCFQSCKCHKIPTDSRQKDF